MKGTFRAGELVKLADGYDWNSQPSVGAEVQLNSGGPKMTIAWYDGDQAHCIWDGGQEQFDWRLLRPYHPQYNALMDSAP